jgi:NitT/TauT family transport system substrate-binding protein
MKISFRLKGAYLLAAIALLVGACTPAATPTPEVIIETVEVPVEVIQTVEVEVEVIPEPTIIRVAMGNIPNFQYAPFYVGLEKGFFAEEGIQLILDYGTEEDTVKRVSAGTVDFGTASGDAIILARNTGIPVTYVVRWFNGGPNVIFSLKEANITKPSDLIGKTIGVPGPFGANWMSFQALLAKEGINPDDIDIQMIGFTQVAAVSDGLVDAAAGFTANEPIQMQAQGFELNIIDFNDYIDLVPIGLFTSEQYIQDNSETVQKFVRAFLHSVEATLAEPNSALEAVISAVQFSGGPNRATTQAGLEAIRTYWTNPGPYSTATFEETQSLMLKIGVISEALTVEEMFTNEFVEGAGY